MCIHDSRVSLSAWAYDSGDDMANILKPERQRAIISALVEGTSIRSVERMTGAHRDTITRLMQRVATGCQAYTDRTFRNLDCKHLEVDEVWCFVAKKQRHLSPTDDPQQVGDFWTWIALDASTKLVPTHVVGKRDAATAQLFIDDLASRLANRVQISSDALRHYVNAIDRAFGGNVDYSRIVKSYETDEVSLGRYSPPKVVAMRKTPIIGNPDLAAASTSYVERGNLTLRMSSRRFTRLTNAFSKRADNLRAAVALHFAWYNLVRRHATLKTTPAVAARVESREWTIGDLLDCSN